MSTRFSLQLAFVSSVLVFSAIDNAWGQAGTGSESAGGGGGGGFGGGGPRPESQRLDTHSIKLPKSSLAPLPDELTRPIGIAPKNRPILEKLQTRRISLDVRDVPLSDVLANVRDQVGFNVLLDRPALEEEGITPNTPISVSLIDVPLATGLARILDQYNLTYTVKHGVLMITSKLTADNELINQVYPVADLVWTPDSTNKEPIDYDTLIELLEQTVAPNSWSSVGGPATIRPFSGNLSLAINQTQAVHEEIVNVLDSLRQVRVKRDAAEQPRPVEDQPRPAIQPAVVGVKQRETELLRATRESMTSLSFVETPLADVVDFLREASKLPFDLDRPALEEEGINGDTPVSIEVSDVGLDDALYLLLGQYNLTWIVKNDVILITSMLTADNELRPLSYPVGDLVVLSDGDQRWSVFQCELQDLIQNTISPNSWSSVGGAGTVQYFPASQCLMVNQTHTVHEQLAAQLAMLRESSDRLPAISRAAGMPTPEKLAEHRLKSVRADEERAQRAARNEEHRAAEAARREAEDAKDPKSARRRAELELIKAQIRQAEAAAAKSEAELAQLKAKSLPGVRDMSKPPGPEVCPHCGKPIAAAGGGGLGGF